MLTVLYNKSQNTQSICVPVLYISPSKTTVTLESCLNSVRV